MRISRVILAIAATTVLITGCARQKNEATQALSAIETSVNAVKEDASKYAPEALQGVESTLTLLKDALTKEDYKAVLAGTPQLSKSIDSLKEAIATGKQRFEAAAAEWTTLNTDVPQMVAAIQSRVDILSSAKKLPKNLTQEAFDGAKAGLDSMKATWEEATAAASSGDSPTAVEKAQAVKAKGAEVLAALGMTSS